MVLHWGGSHHPSNCCSCSWQLDNVSIRESIWSFTAKTHFCESAGDVSDTKPSASPRIITWKPYAASELPHNFYEVLSPGEPVLREGGCAIFGHARQRHKLRGAKLTHVRALYSVNSATSLAETPSPVQVPKPRSNRPHLRVLRRNFATISPSSRIRRPRAISPRWQFGDPRLRAKCGITTNNARRFSKNT